MTNKIVQLTDRDRQPIYPIAGAMAEEAVETGMIKDSAVTSDKIDCETISLEDVATSVPSTTSSRTRLTTWTNNTGKNILVFFEVNTNWASNATGTRGLWVGTASRRLGNITVQATNGGDTGTSVTAIYKMAPNEYIRVEGWQNSGAELASQTRITGFYIAGA